MRNFLAILKDSYKEAVSGWILHIMLVIGMMVILFILSISFTEVGMKAVLDDSFAFPNRLLRNNTSVGSPQMLIENYSQTNAVEPWKSAYQFEFVLKCPTRDDLKKAKDARLPTTSSRVESEFEKIQVFEGLKVEEIRNDLNAAKDGPNPLPEPGGAAEARFRVSASGTQIRDRLEWPHQVNVLFFVETGLNVGPRSAVYLIEKWIVSGIGGWVILFISVIVTAGFIPNMIGKGALDLIVSKPISKVALYWLKYVGGLTYVFLLSSFIVLGIWLSIGIRSGIWSTHFLMVIPIMTFYFAILYSVSAFTAMLTRNALVSILATGLAWGMLWGIGKINDGIANREDTDAKISERLQKNPDGFGIAPDEDGKMPNPDEIRAQIDPNRSLWGIIPKSTFPVFKAIHFISPRTYQLDARLGRTIAEGVLSPREMKLNDYPEKPRENWGEMIIVSVLGICFLLGLGSWRFVTRDG
jgi:ABC-type transport system involved in multi-copper enzyme maturation permease subunit